MEQLIAYNLYRNKEKFIELLKKEGFRYNPGSETTDHISVKGFGINLGRIMESDPPHLIIYSEGKYYNKKGREGRSRLIELASVVPE